ncbi:hypothetical protein [Pseudomonas shirazensis]|uniref:hypothetical protein n=1 Tax=Pseudomonas shirazensis TaxID=2745494 RepID=UPI003D2D7A49
MRKTSLFLLSVLFSPSLLAAPMVEAFLGEQITVLDDQGGIQREVASASLGKQPLPVLQYNKDLDLVEVELAGQKVWLDPLQLRINPPLNMVKMPCEKLPTTLASDHKNNSTMGYGGCSE